MRVDFGNTNIFFNSEIEFDKDINFVFGKNGTGKSTITSLIQEQYGNDLDIRIFQGFDSILGEDRRLNAVTLGEENTSINEQISSKETEKEKLLLNIEEMSKEIQSPDSEDIENSYSKLENSKKEKSSKIKEIEAFYTRSAATIAKDNRLVENARTYRKDTFKKEIANAKIIEKDELEKNSNILKSEKKVAKRIDFPRIDPSKYQDSVNEILLSKVESKIILDEIANDSDKTNFAETGMHIHNPGEVCSFCGNLVTEERLNTLKSYFSADEVELLKRRIAYGKDKIISYKNTLLVLKMNIEDFYPDFVERAKVINKKIETVIESQISFFDSLLKALDEKEKNLFQEEVALSLKIPEEFADIISEHEQIVKINNEFSENLVAKQGEARQALRLCEVKKIIDEFKLESELVKLEALTRRETEAQSNFDIEVNKVEKEREQINKINSEITILKSKTKNTEKLAHNINDRLRYLVSFELTRKKVDDQEFYEIKNHQGEIRPITEISTGEKNIIAFLYFIEKLSEVSNSSENVDKVIVFDDPMTSNDDTMQYLIIDELQKIIKNCNKKNNSNKFILLTHNTFFYLNCSFEIKNRRDGKNAYEESNFYKLQRCETQTKIRKIENRQKDFKTNYEALWHELVYLYSEEKPEMMLNPIRRIIETYVVFNGKEDFYKKNKDAKNLFNTNSHYFPDLEADLNGKDQEDIKNILKKCFIDNGAENHFNKHWNNAVKNG
ncbi:AAA family ATPase [Enterococcus devriesei]|uniref:AAA family ATPase n=1 Tax=Enterococcus devriesei TaxID=319970 RepID=UPI0036D3ED14